MITQINKSQFRSKIGNIYYLWICENKEVKVVFIGNYKKNFYKYLEKLKNNCKGINKIIFIEKKYQIIESTISNYLNGRSKDLNIKAKFLTGTKFERKIWDKTSDIRYGRIISYKKITGLAGYPCAWRAAGTALSKNPIMLVVPCHRVVKSNGSLGKFTGGEKIKRFLLNLERSDIKK
ncbi:MAG: MGMT family protein [Actinobacteria bacterium]|nr:MGMT family protein [Actinomycetota bacterium]